MAIKIVELAKSLGFTVEETYVQQIETTITNNETSKVISTTVVEEEIATYPITGVKVTANDDNTTTTITTTLVNTKYKIIYDAEHTEEDLQIVLDFVQYLEYLEKWDGKLPSVISGSEGIEIIIPGTDNSTQTNP